MEFGVDCSLPTPDALVAVACPNALAPLFQHMHKSATQWNVHIWPLDLCPIVADRLDDRVNEERVTPFNGGLRCIGCPKGLRANVRLRVVSAVRTAFSWKEHVAILHEMVVRVAVCASNRNSFVL